MVRQSRDAGGGEVRCLAFSPDHRRLVTPGFEGVLRLWDLETGQLTLTLPGDGSYVLAVGFSRDGVSLLSRRRNGVIQEWDAHPRPEPGR